MSVLCNVFEIQVLLSWKMSCMDPKDLQPSDLVRYPYLDLPVEPSRPSQGRIDRIHTIRGCHNHHLLPPGQAVHQGEKLGHDPSLHLPGYILTFRCNGIDLVNEDDARFLLHGGFELLTQLRLALAIVHVHDLRPLDRYEIGTGFHCHSLCNESLSRSRRAVKEDSARSRDPKFFKEFRMFEREFDKLPDPRDLVAQTPDILVGTDTRKISGIGFLPEIDDRILIDDNDTGREGCHDAEGDRFPPREEVHSRYVKSIPCKERSVEQTRDDKIVDVIGIVNGFLVRENRSEHHIICLRGDGLPCDDLFTQGDPDIGPGKIVHHDLLIV